MNLGGEDRAELDGDQGLGNLLLSLGGAPFVQVVWAGRTRSWNKRGGFYFRPENGRDFDVL